MHAHPASLVSHGSCDVDRPVLSAFPPTVYAGDRCRPHDHKSGDRGYVAKRAGPAGTQSASPLPARHWYDPEREGARFRRPAA